jgi:PAS domain S-box-containing protein
MAQTSESAALTDMGRIPNLNPGPILKIRADGNLFLANIAACEIFGSDVVGKSWINVLQEMNETLWSEILNAPETVTVEGSLDSRTYLFRHRHEPDGDLIIVFGAEITEQKQAEEFAQLLLNSSGEGIYGIDLTGACTFANPATAALLGYESTDELLGKNMHQLVHHTRPNGEHYPIEECQIYRAFRKGKGTHVDSEVMFCANGNAFQCEYWSHPMIRDGEVVGCVVTFVDISERKRVENELRQIEKMAALGKLSAGLAHELNNPAAAADRAAVQIREKIDELQSVTIELANAQLDSRTWGALQACLQRILKHKETAEDLSPLEASDREDAVVEWLEEHKVPEAWVVAADLVAAGIQPENLDSLREEIDSVSVPLAVIWIWRSISTLELAYVLERCAETISELVGRVKSYSHMDRAPSLLLNIHDGLEDTLAIMKHKLQQGVEVVRDYDREAPEIQAQGNELNQVWTNLIDNAVSAMNGEGTLVVKTYCVSDELVVSLTDSGPGIPDDIRHRIFEPFFTTKDVGVGTGLGLDVANRIITGRCGGKIELDSVPGKTEFRVFLPITQSCQPENLAADAEE